MKRKFHLDNDFLDFLKFCNHYKVQYLVIGGYAVSIHGYPRSTKDLDVCIALSEDNAEKMLLVINDFGFSSLGLTKSDFLKERFVTQLGYPPLRIDIINSFDGISFEEAWNNRREVTYEGVLINFIGYGELLKTKENAGRPQDLADLHKLKSRNPDK